MSTLATISTQSPNHRTSVVSCLDKVNNVIMQLASLQSKAMAYETALLQRQEVLQELVESINEFNTMAAEFDVMVDSLDEELSSPLLVLLHLVVPHRVELRAEGVGGGRGRRALRRRAYGRDQRTA